MSIELRIKANDGVPYVTQIYDQLRTKIQKNELRAGEKVPSMRELAEQCGVSLGIVKQAVNTLTTEGFLRSHPGRGLYVVGSETRRASVALVLPALDFEQMPKIIRGVKAGLGERSARLILQAADFDYEHEANLFDNLNSSFVSGAIIYPPPMNSFVEPLRMLRRRGVPFVLVDTMLQSLEADSVATDRLEAGRITFGYLLERGHRRIGVVDHTGDAISHIEIREGADEVLRKYGLSFAKLPRVAVSIEELNPTEPWANGMAAGKRLLEMAPDVTALVGMNDNIGMGAYLAAKACGRSIPKDISVITIGDLQGFAMADPPVTAMDQPHEDMGRQAALRLLELFDSPIGRAEQIRLAPRIIERASVRSIL